MGDEMIDALVDLGRAMERLARAADRSTAGRRSASLDDALSELHAVLRDFEVALAPPTLRVVTGGAPAELLAEADTRNGD